MKNVSSSHLKSTLKISTNFATNYTFGRGNYTFEKSISANASFKKITFDSKELVIKQKFMSHFANATKLKRHFKRSNLLNGIS